MHIRKCRQTKNYSSRAHSGCGPRGDWSNLLLLDAKCPVISDQSERVLGMLLSFLCRPCYCPLRGVVWPLEWPLITIWESPFLSITYMTPISFSYFVCSDDTRCDLRRSIQSVSSHLLLYLTLDGRPMYSEWSNWTYFFFFSSSSFWQYSSRWTTASSKTVLHCSRSRDSRLQFLTPTSFRSSSTDSSHISSSFPKLRIASGLSRETLNILLVKIYLSSELK
jgi:hypothetical protein